MNLKNCALVLCTTLLFFVCTACSLEPDSLSTPMPNVSEAVSSEEVKLEELKIDPPYDFDPQGMLPSDFGDFFTLDYPDSETSSYQIGADTQWSNEVTTIRADHDGPTVYIIAGVHGDESAAWLAGNLLKKISLQAGSIYILAPANRWGAFAEPPSRFVTESQDLNRSFPGKSDGTVAEQAAAIIYEDVARVKPDFVFDLHEAHIVKSGSDFLGSSLIFTDLKEYSPLLMKMVLETKSGTLCSEPFDYFSPGPEGSVNKTFSSDLSTPTLTVETFRGYQMERRIADQLAVVQYVLRDFGMVD